ncbi:MAG TPA: HDIG domain-containing protein [Sumerlaeia bacterium]|nr:HDIG domain-containing protein [Sumerlaeia bacterium]
MAAKENGPPPRAPDRPRKRGEKPSAGLGPGGSTNGERGVARSASPSDRQPRVTRIMRLGQTSAGWFVLALVLVATVLLVSPALYHRLSREDEYYVGTRVTENIEAIVSFSVPDAEKLDREEERLRSRAHQYYRWDRQASVQVLELCDAFFLQARFIASGAAEEPEAKLAGRLIEWAARERGVTLDPKLAAQCLERSVDENLRRTLREALRHVYDSRGIVDDLSRYTTFHNENRVTVSSAPRRVSVEPQDLLDPAGLRIYLEEEYFPSRASGSVLSTDDAAFLGGLAGLLARPNIAFSPEKTEERLSNAIAKLRRNPPVTGYKKGDVLVKQGQLIAPEDIRLIRLMNGAYDRVLFRRLLAITVYLAILLSLALYYFGQFRKDMRFNVRNILVVSLLLLIPLALGRVLLVVFKAYPEAAPYAFPAGLIGMLAVILLDTRSAVLLVTVGCLAFSVATGLDFKVFLTLLLGGYAAIGVLTTMKERREVISAGLVVGVVNALLILLINFIDDPNKPRLDLMIWGIGNGLLCAILAMPLLVLFESFFDIVTDIRLLELTGLDHPLFQELEAKAPGSYQHSLNVCKLGEAAARAIGANYLLVRAGAYYHDVGKVLKPKYSGENQISIEEKSLHGKISPYMSAMVIKNHVKAGMELARKHRLPERVIDFIPQHHGTTIIAYFYHEALKRFENSQSTDPVREADFRYPGPRPQSIETAVVMLADSVEATATSRFTSLSVNEDELRVCVQRIIADKFNDGQFDECDLTLRDLHLIRESFIKTLLSRFHHRIAYPSEPSISGPAAPTPKRDRMQRG